MAGAREQAQELWAMADLVTPMAVRVAATLRLADHVAQGTVTAGALAEATGADADALERLLRHLVTAGILVRDGSAGFSLSGPGEALREGHPGNLRAMLDTESAIGRSDLSFVHLLHSVLTGEPAFPLQYGRPFWEDLAADPQRTASFDAQMGADVGADAAAIVAAYDWGALGHVVDVGGGNGALLLPMLRAHTTLRGTVFDQPQTADGALAAITAAGFSDRCDAIGGSFFDALPRGAHGYILSAIIHDWDDDGARAILRRCAEAAGPAGAVFVVEKIGGDGESLRTAMDLRVLAYMAGKERDLAQIASLAGEASLVVAALHPADALAIVELRAR